MPTKKFEYNPNNRDAVAFREHRRRFPQIYTYIAAAARDAKWNRGYQNWSVSSLIEVIRWSDEFKLGKDSDGYKINDHVASYYSREIMMKEPDLYGFFKDRLAAADYAPLGPRGEMWADFQMAKLDAELAAEYAEETASS